MAALGVPVCQDWHTADDIVSVAVGRLYEHWSKAREADNIDAYAQRILARSWLNEARRPWRRERPHEAPLEHGTVDVSAVVDRESLADLLRSLAPGQRAVIPPDMVLSETELVAIADEVVHRVTG